MEEKEFIKDDTYNSHLNEEQKKQVESAEHMIFQQFQDEHECKLKLYICEDNIDNQKQTIARTLGENADEKNHTYLANLEIQQQDLESKYKEQVDKRPNIQNVI